MTFFRSDSFQFNVAPAKKKYRHRKLTMPDLIKSEWSFMGPD